MSSQVYTRLRVWYIVNFAGFARQMTHGIDAQSTVIS